MAGKKQEKAEKSPEVIENSGWIRVFLALISVFGKGVERVGVPTMILLLLLFVVKMMGSTQTQDDFVREVLFGTVTPQTPEMRWFVGALVLLIIVLGLVRLRDGRTESAEMKRIAKEKSRLQEKVIGMPLAHTDGHAAGNQETEAAARVLGEPQ